MVCNHSAISHYDGILFCLYCYEEFTHDEVEVMNEPLNDFREYQDYEEAEFSAWMESQESAFTSRLAGE